MVEEQSTFTSIDMTYVVSLSGDVGSAVAAERALECYGTRVKLWFSEMHHEDGDLYRFMQDTVRRWWQALALVSSRAPQSRRRQRPAPPVACVWKRW
jgi:hypothetical protein